MKTQRLNKSQKTQDMRQSVAQRLETRYGTRPTPPFSYSVNPDGTIKVVYA